MAHNHKLWKKLWMEICKVEQRIAFPIGPDLQICVLSCDAVVNILFTISCQFTYFPISHKILENSYRNWEIWVYKVKSICCAFSLYSILYFIPFIFFFIYFMSKVWTGICVISVMQEGWVRYQNNKKWPRHPSIKIKVLKYIGMSETHFKMSNSMRHSIVLKLQL